MHPNKTPTSANDSTSLKIQTTKLWKEENLHWEDYLNPSAGNDSSDSNSRVNTSILF